MIEIIYTNLNTFLQNYTSQCYFLIGKDFFLLKEAQNLIIKYAKRNFLIEKKTFFIERNLSWEEIFIFLRIKDIFCNLKILVLIFPEENSSKILENKNFLNLIKSLNKETLLIIRSTNITINSVECSYLRNLKQSITLVNCFISNKKEKLTWISNKVKNMNLKIDSKTEKFLLDYFKANLFEINQVFIKCSLIYEDKKLTISKIKSTLNEQIYFASIYDWINASLLGNYETSLKYFYYLKRNKIEPNIIIYNIQYDILILLFLKLDKLDKNLVFQFFFKNLSYYKIRYYFLINVLKRFDLKNLLDILDLISKTVFLFEKDRNYKIFWSNLEKLFIMILFGKSKSKKFLNY